MKNIRLFFVLIVLCGCSADGDFCDNMDQNVVTRSNDGATNYCFDFYHSPSTTSYDYTGGTKEFTIHSYMETDGVVTDLEPEIISKPDWVDSIECRHVYYKIYVLFVRASENNTNSERRGTLIIGQPNSSKRLSIPLSQEYRTNLVNVYVTAVYDNRYEFRAITTYPVKEAVTISVPFDVYNDNGEMKNELAQIIVEKNKTVGTTIKDYNGCPLVYYYGNLKGYRLYEGRIWANDIYNYSFNRYW